MLMIGRMLTMIFALLGGIVFSQAPEFAQQYRQRIGGALDELRAVVGRFDSEASRNGLDRDKALGLYSGSPEQFLRSQGQSMRDSFDRFQTLERQSRELADASPLAKPFVILRHPDPDLVTSAWSDFSPGVPVTIAGLVWAGIGIILGWLAAALLGTASLRAARPSKARRSRRDGTLLSHPDVVDARALQVDPLPEHSLRRLPEDGRRLDDYTSPEDNRQRRI